jgi:MFS family permease
MSALVFQLTSSSTAVGATTAILRFGWLFPQLFVGFAAQHGGSSMRYYTIGAFGRAICIVLLSASLLLGGRSYATMAVWVLGFWTLYSFVSGIVAVPYNDIVARSVVSEYRSRLLAVRFFGGGLLALGVAAVADQLIARLPFPMSYSAVFAIAAVLMLLSSIVFVSAGEPAPPKERKEPTTFMSYLTEGVSVFRRDRRFRLFVFAQWCGGAVLMATPFYVVQATALGFNFSHIALLLGAQTTGALLSNALWGWWGDHLGKQSLMKAIALGRVLPPLAVLALTLRPEFVGSQLLAALMIIFFFLGAIANGLTIAVIGLLMEISPDARRPAYSGYFNAITAPVFLLPFFAGVFADVVSLLPIFVVSSVSALLQLLFVSAIGRENRKSPGSSGSTPKS